MISQSKQKYSGTEKCIFLSVASAAATFLLFVIAAGKVGLNAANIAILHNTVDCQSPNISIMLQALHTFVRLLNGCPICDANQSCQANNNSNLHF